MTRSQIAIGALLLLGAVACAGPTTGSAGTPTGTAAIGSASGQSSAGTTPAAPPPDPKPANKAPCPYLDEGFVEQVNGQRVSKVAVSADGPPPACFFYRADGSEQLRVQVLVGADPTMARALVDRAAPVATSDPAQLPGGWDGGKQPTDSGAVFAVYKAGAAVVVVGNQQQTIKVSRVAEQVIAELGL